MKSVLTTICLLFVLLLNAQNTIKGKVTDAKTREPIVWADVILYQQDIMIKGVTTLDTGDFSFDKLPKDNYTLKISYLGYETFERIISFSDKSLVEVDVQLTPSATQLDEIVIQAEVTTIQYKSDRKIVNVGKDLLATGTQAGEILGQLPSVEVDNQNNISLRGDQNVKILVDGKNSPLPNDRLLQQIPSDAIAKIELINNPSAKYQAEGLSGIINIITKKSYRKGGRLNVNLGYGTGEEPRANAGLGFSYATEKFKVSADYNYNTGFFIDESLGQEERQTIEFLSDSRMKQTFESPYYAKTGFDFYIDSTNTLSASVALNKFGFDVNERSVIDQTSTIDQTTSNLEFLADNGGGGRSTTYNLNYRKEYDGSMQYLEADANYSTSPFNFFSNRLTTSDDFTETQNDDFNNMSRITTLSSDYYHNNENRTLELGVRAELRDLDESQFRIITNQTVTDITTLYNYNDGIYAGYGVYNRKVGKVDVKLGLRLEHTDLKLRANDSELENDYTNLFPSASFSYSTEKDHNFSLNYSRRIARPSFWIISNTTFQRDQYSQFMGNPELQPEFANKFELNYSKNFKGADVNASLFLTNKENTIRRVQTINGNNVVFSFDNVGNSNLYGLELYSRLKPAKWWTATVNATYYLSYFSETGDTFLNDQTFSHNYSLNNTFKPFKGFNIQANVDMRPKSISLQGENEGVTTMNVAFSKDILKDKANIALRINDVFNSGRTRSIGEVNGLEFNRTSFSPSSRHLYLSFRYNLSFGNKQLAEKNRQRKQREYTERQ
ncbi:TonB-dependent receptor [Polaribacter batillariae]|uniref:TonB-dependent receptor n=1 Tax=Polaribacter batillariae TaxID=2808900 RepID=A0ABX7SQT9_9FLAO|nr:outer membrane beta-barrel family protein [Polaribacter batillariae]QTD36587.1 TonB-dependent receptor [Polaribacter batillariae]